MSEDWASVAAEVADAIASVGDVAQPEGFPVTLKRAGAASGGSTGPGTPGSPTYTTMRAVETVREIRDRDGTLTGQTMRTLMVAVVAGVTPLKSDQIAVGVEAGDVDASTVWEPIFAVRSIAPAGTILYHELDLEI